MRQTLDPPLWSVETQGVVAVWASLTRGQIIFCREGCNKLRFRLRVLGISLLGSDLLYSFLTLVIIFISTF